MYLNVFVFLITAKNVITELLQQNPQERLSCVGPHQVKEHPYLIGLDWNSLLRYNVYIFLLRILLMIMIIMISFCRLNL